MRDISNSRINVTLAFHTSQGFMKAWDARGSAFILSRLYPGERQQKQEIYKNPYAAI